MPSELKGRGARGRHQELRDWAMKSGVSLGALREAVYAVGTDAAKVEIYLKVRMGPKRTPSR